MNGWAHLVKAIGLAIVGDESDEPAAPARTKRNPYARKKGCCNAKRAASPAPGATSAPAIAAPGLGGVRGMRQGSGE